MYKLILLKDLHVYDYEIHYCLRFKTLEHIEIYNFYLTLVIIKKKDILLLNSLINSKMLILRLNLPSKIKNYIILIFSTHLYK